MSQKTTWEDEGYKITVTGVFGNDYLDTCVKATSDLRFASIKYAIVDFNQVDDFLIDSSFVQKIAISDANAFKVNPHIKLAIIANKTVMTGLVSMYKTYFELNNNEQTWDMNMFENEDDARKWINA